MSTVNRNAAQPRQRKTVALLKGAVATRDVEDNDVETGVGLSWRGVESRYACHVHEDFLQNAGGTLPAPWATADTSASGSPTLDYVDNADNGAYRLKLAATDESEIITLYWGDDVFIEPTKQPYFEARVTYTNASPAAEEALVIGLADAQNDTLDSVAKSAWFLLTGANNNILYESDDATTNDDDNDSGVDWVSGTAFVLGIDFSNLAAVAFYVDGTLVGTTDMSALTGNLQPFVQLQKSSGTTVPQIDIDYIDVDWMR